MNIWRDDERMREDGIFATASIDQEPKPDLRLPPWFGWFRPHTKKQKWTIFELKLIHPTNTCLQKASAS